MPRKRVVDGIHTVTIQIPLDCEAAERLVRLSRDTNRSPERLAADLLADLLEDDELHNSGADAALH
jgi:predicted transcriptional regulator